MTDGPVRVLHRYLQGQRAALVWKLNGLGEREVRLPMTSSGTNLLGLVKHLAYIEFGYFGTAFGRTAEVTWPWDDTANVFHDLADMAATADESKDDIIALYHRAWAHSDETILDLPINALGRVPWWDNREVTLHTVLVHVIAETARHAGHADILREQIDHSRGLNENNTNLPEADAAFWQSWVGHLTEVAEQFPASR